MYVCRCMWSYWKFIQSIHNCVHTDIFKKVLTLPNCSNFVGSILATHYFALKQYY